MADLLRVKGSQVGLEVIGNEHINPLSPITETKLTLDYSTSSLYNAIGGVTDKKVLTYIGVEGAISSGTNKSKVVTTEILAASPSGVSGGTDLVAGIITAAPNNKVQIRVSSNKQPIEAVPSGPDVFGRLTFSGGVYTLSYYALDESTGNEVAFTMLEDVGIDILFPESIAFTDLPFNALATGVAFVDGLPAAHTHSLEELTGLTVSEVDINDLVTQTALGDEGGAAMVGVDEESFTNLAGGNLKQVLVSIDSLIGTGSSNVVHRNGIDISTQAGNTVISLGESYIPGTLALFVQGLKQMRTVVGQESKGQFIETDPAAGTFTILPDTITGDILAVDYDHLLE